MQSRHSKQVLNVVYHYEPHQNRDGKNRKLLSILEEKLERRKDVLYLTLCKKYSLDKVPYKFGKDKNEFIADEVLVSDQDNHHNLWVFERDISK